MITRFDSHAAYKNLTNEGGFSDQQAEAVISAIMSGKDDLITNADLDNHKLEMLGRFEGIERNFSVTHKNMSVMRWAMALGFGLTIGVITFIGSFVLNLDDDLNQVSQQVAQNSQLLAQMEQRQEQMEQRQEQMEQRLEQMGQQLTEVAQQSQQNTQLLQSLLERLPPPEYFGVNQIPPPDTKTRP